MAGNQNSGRKRQPTALKRLLGLRVPADRADEPHPDPGVPRMPKALKQDRYALEEWRGLVKDLRLLRVLTVADGRALGQLSMALADHRRMFEAWAGMGFAPVITPTWIDSHGHPRTKMVENPVVRQLRMQKTLIDQLLGGFGMSPATRSKVAAAAPKPGQQAQTAIGRSLDLVAGKRAG